MRCVFVSDIHLGHPDNKNDKKFFSFLHDAPFDKLFVIGDLFDLYFLSEEEIMKKYPNEYKYMKTGIAEGKVVFIKGNHDFCMSSLPTHYPTYKLSLDGKNLLLTHGHLQALERKFYPYLKVVYALGLLQRLFKWLFSFEKSKILDTIFHYCTEAGVPDSALFLKARMREDLKDYDYVICGHTHLPEISEKYINCGDWLSDYSFIVYTSEQGFSLDYYKKEGGE